eukprot:GEMP01005167.1.p1 GENE.GEMP01005167.1~~GEMP01005167.1.p1  ORF type:complete len:812 (+),score=116.55 GEMP01005167.1:252-2687(+)
MQTHPKDTLREPLVDSERNTAAADVLQSTPTILSVKSTAGGSVGKWSKKILHAGVFRDKHYKWYMLAARGYGRLSYFMIFWMIYIIALVAQHNTGEVNDNTSSWRIAVTQLKPDLLVKTEASYWTFISTKLVPLYFGSTWTETRKDHLKLQGGIALEYQYMVGGIALTSIRNTLKVCYRSQVCRQKTPAPNKDIRLKTSKGAELVIPYNDFYGGYTVYIPTIDKNQTLSMIKMYQDAGLFDHSVSAMKVNWISFNPNRLKTITLLEFIAHVSSSGVWSITFRMDSMPYHVYPQASKDPYDFAYRVILEVLVILLALRLVLPLIHLYRSKEVIGTDKNLLGMPSDRCGTPYRKTPTLMWTIMFISWVVWFYVVSLSTALPNFGGNALDTLYTYSTNPIESHAFQQNTADNFNTHVLPFYKKCSTFSTFFNIYSALNGFLILIMTFRFFEYVSFQKRLSMITDTFAGISSELFHLLIVFILVCFSFSLVCLFTFGMLDPSFTNPINGLASLFAMCFGLYRAASTQSATSVGLYKYSPHATNPAYESFLLPEGIFIVFKLLVFMMLFKFIIAMIMDSYKDNHKKHRAKARSIYSDIVDLSSYQFQRLRHALFGRPFVSMEHVARALHCTESQEKSVCDFSTPNSHLYDSERLLEILDRCPGIPKYNHNDTDWAVARYGLPRNQAALKEHKRLKLEQKAKKVDESEMYIRDETELVFKNFDTLKVGFLEIADLDDALKLLEYNDVAADTKIMRELIAKYDDNEDGVLEFAEFESMLHDDVFKLSHSCQGFRQSKGSRQTGDSVFLNVNRSVVRYI